MKRILIVGILLVLVLCSGCTQNKSMQSTSTYQASNPQCGYYTTFGPYDGCYCMDASGYPWGYPPGYNYYVMEDSVSPFEGADNTAPPRKVKIWYYNHSAWVPFKDWPSCKQYGEW